MNVEGRHYRTIWLKDKTVQIINQLALPFKFEILDLHTAEDLSKAIKEMNLRGAGLIGAAAAYGIYLAAINAKDNSFNDDVAKAAAMLKQTRPTASNLAWAVDRMINKLSCYETAAQKREAAFNEAQAIADEDAEFCRRIGIHGLEIIKKIAERKNGQKVNILTHCNAGWLAFVDYGSALSPVYAAFDQGIPVHVWVDETRPRNQGASLTAWELSQHGISHSLISDNAGGHLMQHGLVDLVITGADRVTRQGDAANKIGTYLKALAAKDNNVPFYIAFPSSTFDFSMLDGINEIPIEERDSGEVRYISGKDKDGSVKTVLICPEKTGARNWGFDVTPARLITGLITERGICGASQKEILKLFPNEVEGVVKFSAEHNPGPPPDAPNLKALNDARTKLYKLGLLGVTKDGIGYGNLSIRYKGNQFIISGTATGTLPELSPVNYCLVSSFNPEKNHVVSTGQAEASSESMTHGAVYESCAGANCVIHIHSRKIFDGMVKDNYLSVPNDAKYGSPEMSLAIGKCVKEYGREEGQIVLLGHDEGVIAYGTTVEKAYNLIIELYNKYGEN